MNRKKQKLQRDSAQNKQLKPKTSTKKLMIIRQKTNFFFKTLQQDRFETKLKNIKKNCVS